MITWGARYLLAMSGLSYVAAIAYGLATGGGPIGVLSLGYKQGVGDHLGYGLGIGSTAVFLGLAVVALVTREGVLLDNEGNHVAVKDLRGSSPSFVAPMTALAVALIVAGIAISKAFLVAGLILGVLAALQWAMQAWADGISDDAEVNAIARSKVSSVLDVPVIALMVAGFVVIGVSRVLLAVPAEYSTAIASIVAALVFAVAVFIAKMSPSRNFIASVVAFGAVAVLVGGIVAAGIGERSFDHHSEGSEAAEGYSE